jgi:uroporphyrinogen-III synthase
LETLKKLEYQHSKIFAVGAATANKLNEYGFEVDAFPSEKPSSEALLALPEIKALVSKDILIFRGKGGRETLKEGLEQYNTVEYIEVYQRVVCDTTPLHHSSLSEFLQSNKGIITATSVENLSALLSIIEKINVNMLGAIKRYPLVVLSERIKTFAQSVGFTQVKVATKISDKGLLEALTNLTKL